MTISNWPTLVLQEHLVFLWEPILMRSVSSHLSCSVLSNWTISDAPYVPLIFIVRWWLYGTEHQKFFWAVVIIRQRLICGLSAASLQRLRCKAIRCSPEIQRLIKYSKSSGKSHSAHILHLAFNLPRIVHCANFDSRLSVLALRVFSVSWSGMFIGSWARPMNKPGLEWPIFQITSRRFRNGLSKI